MIDIGKELQDAFDDGYRTRDAEIVRCMDCRYFQCNMRPDGSLPLGADEYECRHWCGYCDPMNFCSYGERREEK